MTMERLDSPVEAMAAALHAACLRDLPDIHYRDRDWAKHRQRMNSLSREEKAAYSKRISEGGEEEGEFIDKVRRPAPHDVHVAAMFPQMWGSTALGFGGIGGAAMTTAYTIIIESPHTGHFAVYFGNGGRLAYIVPAILADRSRNELARAFHEDLLERNIAAQDEATQRYGAIVRQYQEEV